MLPFQRAIAALGWRGLVIPDIAILGHQVTTVVRLLHSVHTWRKANGWPPEADPTWFRSWSEPDLFDRLPVAAIEIVGFAVPETEINHALNYCGTLLTLAPAVVVVGGTASSRTGDSPADPWSLFELDYYGVGVVQEQNDGATVLVPPENRCAEFGTTLFGRWLKEVLYEKALAQLATPAVVPG
jgi:hypothetical protein